MESVDEVSIIRDVGALMSMMIFIDNSCLMALIDCRPR